MSAYPRQAAYRQRHPERVKGINARYVANNPEKVKESKRRYRAENRTQHYQHVLDWREIRSIEWRRNYDAVKARKSRAAQNGYKECTEYPPPPSDSKCAICHRHARLCLDHDHETGKFRGYLCNRCNAGLGSIGDTIEAVRRALDYLERADG